MKRSVKILSLLLTLVMLLSLCPAAAFAEGGTYMDFDGVFTLGDSNAMAYGLNGYKGGQVDENGTLIPDTDYTNSDYLHCVHGSFQDVVRQGLGLDWEKTWSMNYPALRVRDALFYLGGCEVDYYHELAYDYRVINVERDAYGENFIYDPAGTRPDKPSSVFIDRLQEFERPLIISQLGTSDIFFSIFELVLDEISKADEDDIPAIIESVLSVFYEKHAQFRADYPALIKRLQELSPDSTIVLVGMFNYLKDLVITEDFAVPVFNLLQLLFDTINSDIQNLAKQYGCLYADVSNAETLTLVNGISLEDILNGYDLEKVYHASPAGYAYMGRQILKQVELKKDAISTNIVVDLGRVQNISSVLVDTRAVSNWTYDENTHELTVPYLTPFAKTLTVTETTEDGVYLSAYSLTWSFKEGYTAKQFYTTLDLTGTAAKLIKTFGTVLSSMIETISATIKNAVTQAFQ